MTALSGAEKREFVSNHFGKAMKFSHYYKHKFYYEFVDESGMLYALACGDVDGDIYRDHWGSVETIGDDNWLNCFVSDIYIC